MVLEGGDGDAWRVTYEQERETWLRKAGSGREHEPSVEVESEEETSTALKRATHTAHTQLFHRGCVRLDLRHGRYHPNCRLRRLWIHCESPWFPG